MTVVVLHRVGFDQHLPVTLVINELDFPFREFFECLGGAVDLAPREPFVGRGTEQGLEAVFEYTALRRLLGPFFPVVEDGVGALDGWSNINGCVSSVQLGDPFDRCEFRALSCGFGAVALGFLNQWIRLLGRRVGLRDQ